VMKEIFNIMASVNNEQKWTGWEGEILIDEKGKDETFIGRNYAYRQVVVEGNLLLGDKVRVKVDKTTVHYLTAKIMK
jgi:tRNA A37 methylthiotransferase MiaB